MNEGIGTFTISKKCNLKGNCMSMLFGDNASDNYSLRGKSYAFYKLFYNCSNIVNVSNNFLPATTLTSYCYDRMFYYCTNLTTAPELPATTLAYNCYYEMFYCCSSLTIAPELPATTLADSCYYNMFRGCTKLNYIKMLATNISATNCLYSWVLGVASSGTFVKNPAMTTLPTATLSNSYYGIPSGWTVVNDGEESGGNLITFTIEGIEYQAEEGMTFYGWLISDYYDGSANLYVRGTDNAKNYCIQYGNPHVSLQTATNSYSPDIHTDDVIIANQDYAVFIPDVGGEPSPF